MPTPKTRAARAKKAEASVQPAAKWYASYGWHLSTESAGDVALQIVSYDDLRMNNDATIVKTLIADVDITRDEAKEIVGMAREIEDAADAIEGALNDAIDAYRQGNDNEARDLIDSAALAGEEHDDDSSGTVAEILFPDDE